MLQARDDEQQLLVDEALFEARELIRENLDRLGRIAEVLLAKETLERAQIEQIMAGIEIPLDEPAVADKEPIVRLPSLPLDEPELNGDGPSEPAPLPRKSVSPPPAGRANQRSVAPPLNGRKPTVEHA
jgi:hypothetical protein